jgi:hypothetical protein
MPRRTQSAPINFSGLGDNTVIAAASNGPINVYGIMFTVAGATNITFKSAATLLSGAMIFTGNGSSMTIAIDMDEPYFTCVPGNAFIMNSSLAVQVSGIVYYTSG